MMLNAATPLETVEAITIGEAGALPRTASPPPLTLSTEEILDALERTLHEIEALEAIYGGEGDALHVGEDGDSEGEDGNGNALFFSVLTVSELGAARSAVDDGPSAVEDGWAAPRLEVEIRLALDDDDVAGGGGTAPATLRIAFPPGYPAHASAVPFVSHADGTTRTARDGLTERLTRKAEEDSTTGVECAMELAQELREALLAARRGGSADDCEDRDGGGCCGTRASSTQKSYARRWVWCHHITDGGRIRSIVREASYLSLGGYLHGGYPGVVVVEGTVESCDEFVRWIKGNKSRPGGFGRNWGHHVRGEIEWSAAVEEEPEKSRRLVNEFEEVEDLKAFGALCRKRGLEDEFLEYIMQHKRDGI